MKPLHLARKHQTPAPPGRHKTGPGQHATNPTARALGLTQGISTETKTHAASGRPVMAENPRQTAPARTQRAVPTQTQTHEALAPVPSASAATHTMLPSAMPKSSGMATPLPLPKKETKEQSSKQREPETPCVLTGTSPDHVDPAHTWPGTNALAAAMKTMELSPADLHSPRSRISTPYQPRNWHSLLQNHNLLDKYAHIPSSLQYSFNAGIKYITHTFIPPNDKSITTYQLFFQQIIDREFSTTRYEGPFSQ